MLFCRRLIFFFFSKSNFFKKNTLRNTISVSNSLDPDQVCYQQRPLVGKEFAEDTSSYIT